MSASDELRDEYKCAKCRGDIRTIPLGHRMGGRALEAALSLHQDHCLAIRAAGTETGETS